MCCRQRSDVNGKNEEVRRRCEMSAVMNMFAQQRSVAHALADNTHSLLVLLHSRGRLDK